MTTAGWRRLRKRSEPNGENSSRSSAWIARSVQFLRSPRSSANGRRQITITDDNSSSLDHHTIRRPRYDSLGKSFCGYQHQVRSASDSEPVLVESHDLRSAVAAEVKRDLDFLVAAKVIAKPNQHCSLQHVAIAIGIPTVTNAVRSTANDNTGLDAMLHWRRRPPCRAGGHNGDSLRSSRT